MARGEKGRNGRAGIGREGESETKRERSEYREKKMIYKERRIEPDKKDGKRSKI